MRRYSWKDDIPPPIWLIVMFVFIAIGGASQISRSLEYEEPFIIAISIGGTLCSIMVLILLINRRRLKSRDGRFSRE